jgi:hypothetical protein
MSKRFRFDFYQLTVTPDASISEVGDGFSGSLSGVFQSNCHHHGYTRELHDLTASSSGWQGQFRKYRDADLPQIGKIGASPSDIILQDDEGLIEVNSFMYFKKFNILVWNVNGHGSHPDKFASCLSDLWGLKVSISPLIEPDCIKRLMRNNVQLKKIIVTVPRPSNPNLYDQNSVSETMMNLMQNTNSDHFKLELGVNLRSKDAECLTGNLKLALQEFVAAGATKAEVVIDENGYNEPIDLIAQRISSTRQLATSSRYLPAATMYTMLKDVYDEKQGVIDELCGSLAYPPS